jgi:hypothetical protein
MHSRSALRSLPRTSQEAAVASRTVRSVAPGRNSRQVPGHRRRVLPQDRDHGIPCRRATPGGSSQNGRAEAWQRSDLSLTVREGELRHGEPGLEAL